MVLIDRAWRDDSNGCHIVHFDYFDLYYWTSGWQRQILPSWSLSNPVFNRIDCIKSRPMRLAIRLNDRAWWDLSKMPLIAFIGAVVMEIGPLLIVILELLWLPWFDCKACRAEKVMPLAAWLLWRLKSRCPSPRFNQSRFNHKLQVDGLRFTYQQVHNLKPHTELTTS